MTPRFHRRAVLGGAIGGILAGSGAASRAGAAEVTVGNGAVPPDIAFADDHDRLRHLSDFRSRPVVLNLWATWCAPCRHELPSLADFAAALEPDGIAVIPVATDCRRPDAVRAFLDDENIAGLPVFSDPDRAVLSALGVRGIPTTLLLDRDHRQLLRVVGELDWSDPEAIGAVRRLLLRPAPAPAQISDFSYIHRP